MFAMSSTKQDRLIGETRPAERLTSPRALFVEGSVSCFPATRGHIRSTLTAQIPALELA